MSVHRIASRYAKSLLDFATEQNTINVMLEDMNTFKLMAENKDLRLLLKSPIVNVATKKKVFDALFSDKLSKVTNQFFDIVLRKGRESYLAPIAEAFIDLYKKGQGISDIKLTTAAPLSDAAITRIQSELLKSEATDKGVEIQTIVDPEIIGGFILEIEDKLYDDSIAFKLDELKKNFSNNAFESKI